MKNSQNQESELTKESRDPFEADCFGREELAKKLFNIINYNCPFIDDSFVISLNAPFGRGKTTFIRMFSEFLRQKEETVIEINAWETDFAKEPLVPILCTILEEIEKVGNESLTENLKKILNAIFKGGYEIAKNSDPVTKVVLDGAEATFKEIKKQEIDQQFSSTKKQYEDLKKTLAEFVEKTHKKRLIIIVDELDRCRPNYAIEFLEAIKHIFAIKGVFFILAVNKQQLEVSTKALFGEGIKFDNYFLRFVSKEVKLVEGKLEDYDKFNRSLFKKFLENKPKEQKPIFNVDVTYEFDSSLVKISNKLQELINWNSKLFSSFKFEPRQIERFYKDFSYFIYRKNDWPKNQDTSLLWVKGLSFLLVLRILNNGLFNLLPKDHDKFIVELIKELKKFGLCFKKTNSEFFKSKRDFWYFGGEILSFFYYEKNHQCNDKIVEVFQENFFGEDNEETLEEAKSIIKPRGLDEITMRNVFKRIQELKTIEDN